MCTGTEIEFNDFPTYTEGEKDTWLFIGFVLYIFKVCSWYFQWNVEFKATANCLS